MALFVLTEARVACKCIRGVADAIATGTLPRSFSVAICVNWMALRPPGKSTDINRTAKFCILCVHSMEQSGICSARLRTPQLRSALANVLAVPRTNTRLGDRSFSVAGPRIWNSLPASLRQPDIGFEHFKRLLKAFLFGETGAH